MKALRFVPTVRFLVLATFLVFLVFLLVPATVANATQRTTTFADLPPVAQAMVSATLGRDDVTYQFQATTDGYRASNASNTMRADFSNLGMRLATDDAQWTMALHGIGYGDSLETVSQVAPTASANRLEYAHDTFTEWYVNGPVGLEQGWTLTLPPSPLLRGEGGILTLALALEGNARIDASGQAAELLRGDGTTAVRYTGLVAYDAAGRDLRAWMELGDPGSGNHPSTSLRASSGLPLRIRVDDAGAQYPLTIDPTYSLQATLTDVSGALQDRLGMSIALSGDGKTIAVGAPKVNASPSITDTGAVYVFAKPANGWANNSTPTAVLTNTVGLSSGDSLGSSVAINSSGSTIVAGAQFANSTKGAVYVYVRPPGGSWVNDGTPNATLTNALGTSGDNLGFSVAISADSTTIVAGATGVNSEKGAAYVFLRPGASWLGADTGSPDAKLYYGSAVNPEKIGWSVAISADGSTVVTGAIHANNFKGAAYVFVKPGGGWANDSTPNAMLYNGSGAMYDELGRSVAVSANGSTIAMGSSGFDYNCTDQGAVFVFVKPGGGWGNYGVPIYLTNLGCVTGDQLGWSVTISADGATIVTGTTYVGSNKGAVYVFVKPGSNWASTSMPITTLTNPDGAANDNLGDSVSISDDSSTIVTGAYGVNGFRGAAYVYQQWKLYLSLIMK